MFYDLKDYKNDIKKIKENVIEIAKNYNIEEVTILNNEIDEQLKKYTPSIMFYGVYNSGKSSIINVLAGNYIAKVGDVPTTGNIQKIPWNGFMLIDTPGIVANEEHTEIADDEIKRNDVILFVIDDVGTFENKSISTAIVKIIKTGKPIIVVINQKEASIDGAYSEKIKSKIIPKIMENIEMAGKNQGFANLTKSPNYCGIVSINAMTAETAREIKDNKKEFNSLWDLSQFEGLISLMEQELKKSEGINLLKPALKILREEILKYIDNLQAEILSNVDERYKESLKEIERKKSSIFKNIITLGKTEIYSYEDKIYTLISQGKNNEELVEEIKSKLVGIINNQFKGISTDIDNSFNLYNAKFGEKVESRELEFQDNNLNLIKNQQDSNVDIGNILNTISPALANTAIAPAIKATSLGSIVASVGAIAISPIFLASFIPIAGNVIKLFMNKKKEEENEALLKHKIDEHNASIQAKINENISMIIELNNKIRTELMKLEQSFSQSTEKLIESHFFEIISELDKTYNIQREDNLQKEKDLKELKKLLHEVEKIEIILN